MKRIVGYGDRLAAAPGDRIDFRVSCEGGDRQFHAGVVRPGGKAGRQFRRDQQEFRAAARGVKVHGPGRLQRPYLGSGQAPADGGDLISDDHAFHQATRLRMMMDMMSP